MTDDPDVPDPDEIVTQSDFGRALKALRERADLKIRQVARVSGLPHSTVGDYFSGRHLPPDGAQLARLLSACGETDPDAVARWKAALSRVRRSPGPRTDPPYRGLARFEEQDARWFFGREDVTDLLAEMAAKPSAVPLMVVGASGAGKSSLLRAGLLPRLAEFAGPATVFEPGPAPLADLEAHVAELESRAPELESRAAEPGHGSRPTVIVDQFEAVFTLCPNETERREFIARICELATSTLVILAMRADFYDHAISYEGLARALQDRQVVLGPMTAEQVRRAIIEPAKAARLEVEDGLVELLLADLAPTGTGSMARGTGTGTGTTRGAYEPGALPLLSHAMLATWHGSRGGKLTVADYRASGGISDALDMTAERAFGSLSESQRRLARRLFLRLVHVADELPPSRAVVTLSELRGSTGADAWEVLARFTDERMITADADALQITHDTLLTAWPRLRTWIETDLEGLRTRRRITEAARAWEEAEREDAALLRGTRLAVARDWIADEDNRPALPPAAAEFVDVSAAAAVAAERAERRRTRRLKGGITVLTALVMVVCLLAGYALSQRAQAISDRNNANSREIAIEAGQIRAKDPAVAAQLSVAAYAVAHTPEATASLLESGDYPSALRIPDSSSIVQAVAVSGDHRLLAAAGADGTLRLWDVRAPRHAVLVRGLLPADADRPLYATAFSPDGKILAAAGADKIVRLWNVSDPAHAAALGGLSGAADTVYSVAFSPDGRTLAVGSADNTVRLWNVSDPGRPVQIGRPLTGPTGYVKTVAFSPRGSLLAAGTGNTVGGAADDTVWVWDVVNPAHPVLVHGMPLTGPAETVSSVAFGPDGKTIAAASEDDKVWLWKVTGGPAAAAIRAVPDGTLAGAVNWANTLAFSPGGTELAVGTSEARVMVWNMTTRSLAASLPYPQPVTTVAWDGPGRLAASDADGTASIWTLPAPDLLTNDKPNIVTYSPDGRTLAVGGQDIQLWNAAGHSRTAILPLAASVFVNSLAYSPDGGTLGAALADGTVRLLDAKTLAPVAPPLRVTASGNAESVAFSPDGKTLATGGDDGSVRLWSLADPARPRPLALVHDSGTYVFTIAFSPGGKTLAAASTDDLTRLWNVRDPARPVRLGTPLGGLSGYAIGLAFAPDGRLLAVGSQDGTVHLWDVSSPARPVQVGRPLTGPAGYVWATAFSPDGKTLAAGVTDGTVWLWDMADSAHPSLIAHLTGPADDVYSIAFAPSGGQLAASSHDGTIHVWDTSPDAAQAAVCAGLGQPLTAKEWASYVPGVPYHAPCS